MDVPCSIGSTTKLPLLLVGRMTASMALKVDICGDIKLAAEAGAASWANAGAGPTAMDPTRDGIGSSSLRSGRECEHTAEHGQTLARL